jgi:hypothetical protein
MTDPNLPSDVPQTDMPRTEEDRVPEGLDPSSHDTRREEEERAAQRHRDARRRRTGERIAMAIAGNRRAVVTVAAAAAGMVLVGSLGAVGPRLFGQRMVRRAGPVVLAALPRAIGATAASFGVPRAVSAPFVAVGRFVAKAGSRWR